MKYLNLTIIILACLLTSCKQSSTDHTTEEGDTIKLDYAELLTLTDHEDYILAQIHDPWNEGNILHTYILVNKEMDMPKALPEGDVVRIPLSNSIVYTSVHCSLIDEIGAYSAIKGVCDLQYIDIEKLQSDAKAGKIANIGESTAPNIEAIIDLSPDAILLSPFQNSGSYGRLGKLGIPIIECADYMETSALGRAEWVKFYGLLFDEKENSDAMFNKVEKEYNELKELASKAKTRPTVITDFKFGNSWYVPGGNSTIGKLLADAGAEYIFKERTESGSVPLDPEVVFDSAIDAEYWVVKYNQATDKTYSEIAQDYSNYSKMSAFKNHNIYACNTGKVPFYEETPFHPNRLLKDYVKIFHPELLSEYQLRYYKTLLP